MNKTGHELRVLIVEDSENDAMLLEIELQRAGYEPKWKRVESREAMDTALETQKWDLVIADYQLRPGFNGLDALNLLQSRGLDIPFIIVSGIITDNTAVATMKAGAHDYVMKDNLTRLGPAVQRELREAEGRRAARRADEKLKLEQVFRAAIENSVPSGIAVVDLEGRQTYVNPAFCAMVGWSEHELVGAKPPFVYWPPEQVESIAESMTKVIQGNAPASGIELRFRRRNGEIIEVLQQTTPLRDQFGNVTGWVSSASDITERKQAEARLAAEHSITRMLTGAASLEAGGPGILRVLLDSLDMDVGTLWLPDAESKFLHAAALQRRASLPAMEPFLEANRPLRLKPGQSIPGRVWQLRTPICIADCVRETTGERRSLAAKAGLHGGVAFPIQSGGDFFGVFEFFAMRHLEDDPVLLNMMTAIGSEMGQFIQRRRAEEALRRARDELEIRVLQRTEELRKANEELKASMTERRRLENELLEITEEERRRIGLDLHDDLGQKLSGVALMTKGLQLCLARQNLPETGDAAKIHSLVQDAMNHTSDVAHDLATLDLPGKKLPVALSELASHASEMFGISCKFRSEGSLPGLEAALVIQLYKIAQEAVTNAIKHGKARRVAITLSNGSDKLLLKVQNNGKPFPDLKGQSTGMGLRIMNYRANLISANLSIKGIRNGTMVTCTVPLSQKRKKSK